MNAREDHAREVAGLLTEIACLRSVLHYIADNCGDDSRPEDNAVQIARAALDSSSGSRDRT